MLEKWRILFAAIMINYINMEKQQKISKFMKPLKPGEIFESSDIEMESIENNPVKNDKKQPMLINFLNKFNQPDLETMEKYIQAHKYMLELAVKPKITLFEDIIIIYQFRKELAALTRPDRVKTIQAISEKLQPIIKRSKMTIKERIMKKLAHCTLDQVLQAMKFKKDLTFDKKGDKTKKINLVSSNSNEEPQNPQTKKESSRDSEFYMKKQQSQKNEVSAPTQARKIIDSALKSAASNPSNRLYKYGTTNVQQRIYIFANSDNKEILSFSESGFNELKAKYSQLPNLPQKLNIPMQIEGNNEKEILNNQTQQNVSEIQNLKNMSEQQLEAYIQSIKEKACQILSESNSNEATQTHQELTKYLEAIQQLQAKLYAPNNSHNDEDISSDLPEGNSKDNSAKKGTNSTGKKTNMEERATPRKQSNQQCEQKKILYRLSNNINYLSLIKDDPSLWDQYSWSDDEDTILYSFKFNPEAYRTEMTCLLRYKSRQVLLERMKFLKLDLNFSLIEHINKLGKPVEQMIPAAQEKMEIE